MIAIDKKLVRQVAELARLSLTDEEVDYYKGKMKSILDYVAQIEEVSQAEDVAEEQPTPEREDIARPSLDPKAAMQNAPKVAGTSFQVPRIIE